MDNTKDRDSGTAQIFAILGDGTAEVTWVDDYRQGACVSKLSEGRWAVRLPEGDEIVILHEASHVKFSGWDATALSNALDGGNHTVRVVPGRAKELFAVLEDARIDTLGAEWFRRPLHADHGGRLAAERAEAGGRLPPSLIDDVTLIAYDLGAPQTPEGRGALLRFGDRIKSVRHDADPWASARLAYEIDRAFPGQPDQPDQPQPDQGDQGDDQPNDAPQGPPGAQDDQAEAEGEGDGGAEGEGEAEAEGEGEAGGEAEGDADGEADDEAEADQGRALDQADEDEWSRRAAGAQREGQRRKADAAKTIAEARVIDQDVPAVVIVDEIPSVPTVLHEQTQLALDGLRSPGVGRYDRVGAVTPEIWRLGYGESRVFEAPARRRTRVVVSVDVSQSMGCWCEGCNIPETGRSFPGYLAFQAAAAIGQAAGAADVHAWSGFNNSAVIYPLPVGHQPLCTGAPGGFRGNDGTPTAGALQHLGELLGGETAGAIGVIITDGQPYSAEATHRTATRLVAEGVQFVVVVVGNTNAERIADLFPAARLVRVEGLDDLADLGRGIADLLR